MHRTIALASAAAALLFGPAALAQTPQTQAQTGAQGQAGAQVGQFADSQLHAFAEATTRIQQMQAAGTVDEAARANAVTQAGLTVEQYNQIAQQLQTDTALRTRVQQHMAMVQGPAPTGQAGATAQTGAAPDTTYRTETAPTGAESEAVARAGERG